MPTPYKVVPPAGTVPLPDYPAGDTVEMTVTALVLKSPEEGCRLMLREFTLAPALRCPRCAAGSVELCESEAHTGRQVWWCGECSTHGEVQPFRLLTPEHVHPPATPERMRPWSQAELDKLEGPQPPPDDTVRIGGTRYEIDDVPKRDEL